MLPAFFQLHIPTKIVYGPGIVSDLDAEIETLGINKYFLISDHALKTAGVFDMAAKGLEASGVEIMGAFLDVPQDSDVIAVGKCAAMARECGAQGLIAIGGGSVIDTAKAANMVFTHGGDLIEDYSGAGTLTQPLRPLIVIPTTAGTGSEVTLAAVIHDKQNDAKISFADKLMLPDLAVLDPELTITLPASMTAATGMDALTHAIEASMGVDHSPISDLFSAGAIDLIFKNIVTATENGSDIEARGSMLVASMMAGVAFSHSMVGCVHAMAHTVGALYRVPHGIANAILLPHGMEYNMDFVTDKLAMLSRYMGNGAAKLSESDAALHAVEAVRNLTGSLNQMGALPLRLRDVKVPKADLPIIAEKCLEDGTCIYNPREVVPEEILVHLNNAY